LPGNLLRKRFVLYNREEERTSRETVSILSGGARETICLRSTRSKRGALRPSVMSEKTSRPKGEKENGIFRNSKRRERLSHEARLSHQRYARSDSGETRKRVGCARRKQRSKNSEKAVRKLPAKRAIADAAGHRRHTKRSPRHRPSSSGKRERNCVVRPLRPYSGNEEWKVYPSLHCLPSKEKREVRGDVSTEIVKNGGAQEGEKELAGQNNLFCNCR